MIVSNRVRVRQRKTGTLRERDKWGERLIERERERERERVSDCQAERKRERQTDREREIDTNIERGTN